MASAEASSAGVEITQLAGSLGAEVRGISLAEAGPAEAERIQELLHEHLVLFFPDQRLSPEDQIAFGRHFGEPQGHPNLPGSSDRSEVFELRASQGAIADEWHSDLTCQAEPSVMAWRTRRLRSSTSSSKTVSLESK